MARNRLSGFFLAGGFLLLILSFGWQIRQRAIETSRTEPVVSESVFGLPTGIKIPSINLAAPIEVGGLEKGRWLLSEEAALFLPTSGRPGEGFNTVLYAHKRPHLFGGLGYLGVGSEIEVETADGQTFHYKVIEVKTVKAGAVEEIKSGEPDTLTLFTCDGVLDTERLVVRAVWSR